MQRAERSREVTGAVLPEAFGAAAAQLTPRTPIPITPRAQYPPLGSTSATGDGRWPSEFVAGAPRQHVQSPRTSTPRTPSTARSRGSQRFDAEDRVSDRSRDSRAMGPMSAEATPRLASLEDALQRNRAQVEALRSEMRHWENSTAERLAARLHAHVQLEFDRCDSNYSCIYSHAESLSKNLRK